MIHRKTDKCFIWGFILVSWWQFKMIKKRALAWFLCWLTFWPHRYAMSHLSLQRVSDHGLKDRPPSRSTLKLKNTATVTKRYRASTYNSVWRTQKTGVIKFGGLLCLPQTAIIISFCLVGIMRYIFLLFLLVWSRSWPTPQNWGWKEN